MKKTIFTEEVGKSIFFQALKAANAQPVFTPDGAALYIKFPTIEKACEARDFLRHYFDAAKIATEKVHLANKTYTNVKAIYKDGFICTSADDTETSSNVVRIRISQPNSKLQMEKYLDALNQAAGDIVNYCLQEKEALTEQSTSGVTGAKPPETLPEFTDVPHDLTGVPSTNLEDKHRQDLAKKIAAEVVKGLRR